MKEITLYGATCMTVKEVSEALGVDVRTINRHIQKLYPGKAINGVASWLDESQVTEIKNMIERSGRNDLDNVVQVQNVTTELEIAEMTLKVISFHKAEADRLRAELASVAPKVESFDALMRSEKTMSITDAAKYFRLHPKTEVFPYLRLCGYLTLNDLPTQAALDAGYLSLKVSVGQDGRTWPQAVVEAWQLEKWRAHVVHQIKRFAAQATA